MNEAFEDLQFLARSPTRIRAVKLLAATPRNRDELVDELDISRATLSRLLRQLEDRDWIRRDKERYTTTRFGTAMATDITQLLETATTIRQLRGIVQYLPFDDLGIEIHQLNDARITEATSADPVAPARRVGQVLDSAERTRILKHVIDPNASRSQYGAVIDGTLQTEIILTHDAITTVCEYPDSRQRYQDMIANDVGVYRCDDTIPINLKIVDETVLFSLTDDNGLVLALIESDDEDVRSWATDLFNGYRDEATPVGRETFTSHRE
ncbi:helix-turn-helix transcriptional regulator [Halocatena halophila]|uniref:helix-turn-helix transcriptional regulator n=1 Tax=Halocatena halophila TaxID=2814576 RepID=UPI002ED0501F